MTVSAIERTTVAARDPRCPPWCTDCHTYPEAEISPDFTYGPTKLHRGVVYTDGYLSVVVQQFEEPGHRMPVDVLIEVPKGRLELTDDRTKSLRAALAEADRIAGRS